MPPLSDASFFIQKFAAHVVTIEGLIKKLPKTIPVAKKSGRVVEVFTKYPLPAPEAMSEYWEGFNTRMDALFGANLVDANTGRLPNILRGKYGMETVLSYLKTTVELKPEGFQWSAAMPKMLRLVNELKFLSETKKRTHEHTKDSDDGDTNDEDYAPPTRKPRVDEDDDDDDDLPFAMLDSDGGEITVETEQQKELNRKRNERQQLKSHCSPAKKKARKQGSKNAGSTAKTPITFDSGEESDGNSALRKVEEAEAKPKGARRGPANQSMQHFMEPVATTTGFGSKKELRWKFACKFCTGIQTLHRTISDQPLSFDREPTLPVGINNLASHLQRCREYQKRKDHLEQMPDLEQEPLKIPANRHASQNIMNRFLIKGETDPAIPPTQAGFLRIFAAWILDDDLPWTTGESFMLSKLFKYAEVSYFLPSDTTVRNELAKIFVELHAKVVKELAAVKSKIGLATDTWTNKQMIYSFACSIASFIDEDWELIERVIDFRPLESKEHEGIHAAHALVASSRQVGALSKITLTMDNASVNDVLFRNVSRALLTLYNIPQRADNQIRCLAHVINLVAQSMLSSLNEADECIEDGGESDYFLLNKELPIHYNVNDDIELQELESNRKNDLELELEEEDADLRVFEKELEEIEANEAGKSALQKLRFIVNKITSSPQRRQRFWNITMDKYGRAKRVDEKNPSSPLLSKLMVVRDVRTRWNSTHAMIERALILREAINRWVLLTDEYHSMHLSMADWDHLKQLRDVLDCFTAHTQQLSMAKCPTIPFALPIYDAMEKHLVDVAGDFSLPSELRLAASCGHQKLMKYKEPAVKNHNYILGTVLHPFMRSEWFRKTVATDPDPAADLRRKNEVVEGVQILVKAVAEKYQAAMLEETRKPEDSSSQAVTPPNQSASQALSRAHSLASLCDFDFDLPASSNPTNEEQLADELRRYFKFDGGRGLVHDPLSWWKDHAALFPILARMARDFLAIPATSVSVERTFSKSRRICTDLRSSLRAETIRQALLTKLWIRTELFDLIKKPQKVEKHGSKRLLDCVDK